MLSLLFLRGASEILRRRRGEEPSSQVQATSVTPWSSLAADARRKGLGQRVDAAMDGLARVDASLSGVPLTRFGHRSIEERQLAELVAIVDGPDFGDTAEAAREKLASLFEYLLERLTRAEARRADDISVPSSIPRLVVNLLEPRSGQVYDPICGTGEMLVRAAAFDAVRTVRSQAEVSIYGQEARRSAWGLAKLRLAVHGIDGDLGHREADAAVDDLHPDLRADFVLAAPPVPPVGRWPDGGHSAFRTSSAWLRLAVSKLSERGTAGVVLAAPSSAAEQREEEATGRALVEENLVDCVVALPPRLFSTTGVPARLWVLSKGRQPQHGITRDSRERTILFIDATELGSVAPGGQLFLNDTALDTITRAYHAWRGTPFGSLRQQGYEDIPGLCASADRESVRGNGYRLTPALYVRPAAAPVMRQERRTKDLYGLFR
ncbi:N-6 DNA methylase [Streptomyces sedi]|uniref:N-6 DNA methylase n=1 Tax=Streptomyces sedi TaxID=555059 RepID=UPI0014768F60|nr:N-6 DNA methylase [Streptomyces sedi]